MSPSPLVPLTHCPCDHCKELRAGIAAALPSAAICPGCGQPEPFHELTCTSLTQEQVDEALRPTHPAPSYRPDAKSLRMRRMLDALPMGRAGGTGHAAARAMLDASGIEHHPAVVQPCCGQYAICGVDHCMPRNDWLAVNRPKQRMATLSSPRGSMGEEVQTPVWLGIDWSVEESQRLQKMRQQREEKPAPGAGAVQQIGACGADCRQCKSRYGAPQQVWDDLERARDEIEAECGLQAGVHRGHLPFTPLQPIAHAWLQAVAAVERGFRARWLRDPILSTEAARKPVAPALVDPDFTAITPESPIHQGIFMRPGNPVGIGAEWSGLPGDPFITLRRTRGEHGTEPGDMAEGEAA